MKTKSTTLTDQDRVNKQNALDASMRINNQGLIIGEKIKSNVGTIIKDAELIYNWLRK